MPIQSERESDKDRKRLALRIWKVIWDDIKDDKPFRNEGSRYLFIISNRALNKIKEITGLKKADSELRYIIFDSKRSRKAVYYHDIRKKFPSMVFEPAAGIVLTGKFGIPGSWVKRKSIAIHEIVHWLDYNRVDDYRVWRKGNVYYGRGKKASYFSNPSEVNAYLAQVESDMRKDIRRLYNAKDSQRLEKAIGILKRFRNDFKAKGAKTRFRHRLVDLVKSTKKQRPENYKKVISRTVALLDRVIEVGEKALKRVKKVSKAERKSDDQYLRLAQKAWSSIYAFLKKAPIGNPDIAPGNAPVAAFRLPDSLVKKFDNRKDGLRYIIFVPSYAYPNLAAYGNDAKGFGASVGLAGLSGRFIVLGVDIQEWQTEPKEFINKGIKDWKNRRGVLIHEIVHWLKEVDIPAYSDYMNRYAKQHRLKRIPKGKRIDREYWARAQETEINAYLLGLIAEVRDEVTTRIKMGDWKTIDYILDLLLEPGLKDPKKVIGKFQYNTLMKVVPEMDTFLVTLATIKKRRPKVYPKVVKRAKEQIDRIRKAVEKAKKRSKQKQPAALAASLAAPVHDPILEASPYPLEENASPSPVSEALVEASLLQSLPDTWEQEAEALVVERYGGSSKERGIWFHGTSTDIAPAIKSKGLDPYPKVKGFGSSLGGDFSRPSFLSFGGSYLTSNLRDAITAAKWVAENRGGRPAIVCADIQPRSLVADEDDITGMVRDMPTGMPGITYGYDQTPALYFALRYGIGKSLVRQAFKEWIKVAFRHILNKASGKEKRLAMVLKKNKAKVFEQLERIWRAEVKRRAAYVSDWFSKPGHDIYHAIVPYLGDEAKRLEGKDLLSQLPSKDQAERGLQKEVDALTKTFKDLARPIVRGGPARGRSLQPIPWKGKNKVVCLLEIVPDEKGLDTVKVIKGKVPGEFVKQWKSIYGDFRRAK